MLVGSRLFVLCTAVLCAACTDREQPAARNVVLVTIDTLRADHVGAYGGPVPTPALDALAADATYNGKNLVSGRGTITGGTFTETLTGDLASFDAANSDASTLTQEITFTVDVTKQYDVATADYEAAGLTTDVDDVLSITVGDSTEVILGWTSTSVAHGLGISTPQRCLSQGRLPRQGTPRCQEL